MEEIKLVQPTGRYATIVDVSIKSYIHETKGYVEKLQIKVEDENKRVFLCSEIFTSKNKVKGLFLKGKTVDIQDATGKFMQYLGVQTTSEFVGKTIYLYPDKDGFLLPACFDHKSVLKQ